MKRVRIRDCVYWGWGLFWALVVQVLIWWPIVELVVRIASSDSRVGSNPLFYVVLFSLPFIGIAVNFCLFRFLHPRRALGWMLPVAFGFMFLFGLFPMPFRGMSMLGFGSVVCGLYPGILLNNYYELYRLAKMSPEEVEEYQREHEAREAREEQYEEKTADVYISLLFLIFFVIVGFFCGGYSGNALEGVRSVPNDFSCGGSDSSRYGGVGIGEACVGVEGSGVGVCCVAGGERGGCVVDVGLSGGVVGGSMVGCFLDGRGLARAG